MLKTNSYGYGGRYAGFIIALLFLFVLVVSSCKKEELTPKSSTSTTTSPPQKYYLHTTDSPGWNILDTIWYYPAVPGFEPIIYCWPWDTVISASVYGSTVHYTYDQMISGTGLEMKGYYMFANDNFNLNFHFSFHAGTNDTMIHMGTAFYRRVQ